MTILLKLWKSTLYSLAGLRATWNRELAFRLEVGVVLVLLPFLFILKGLTPGQKAIMLVMLILPLILELLNSSIEALCNMLTQDKHPEIQFIKDAASGAVFLSIILMTFTWGFCLWSLI